ncbi:STE/STE7 protein kinase [Paracoccidioides brasiliensis Pb18]|uniref:mitogen-activated protein kinase kinase n=2 Tax=Paracoccidioides brasiliensis TaxID=121759 RepID=C1GHA6_PARBD|nr:STE/STE7 protein kinase [Paracoccidioides brasiliensis Pb18]EEH50563.1 STE/STE7 protein kinase [Paracoccidioides brasiliensis Pb18]ODH12841.1 STE/STE7 protein kinase [Paracoccidioides brasiliensis]ODH53371.1 STE/STE7 protein kinase [Paracoccidioides brasiliensis]
MDSHDSPDSTDDDLSGPVPNLLSTSSLPSLESQLPTLHSVGDNPSPAMPRSSTPLGHVNAARKPPVRPPVRPPGAIPRSSGLNQDIQAKMKAFSLSRQGAPPGSIPYLNSNMPGGSPIVGSAIQGITMVGGPIPGGMARLPSHSSPVWPAHSPGSHPNSPIIQQKMGGLAAKRGLNRGMKLSDATGPHPGAANLGPFGSFPGASAVSQDAGGPPETLFSKYSDFVDTKAGTLNFRNKAIIHSGGIDFTSGSSFSISLDEVDTLEELGKGNYGTVYKVRHCRPHLRRPGVGLRGTLTRQQSSSQTTTPLFNDAKCNTSNVIMAMKEIRLELDEAKFTAIIMELDILHRCVSPFIIDFYGAFFQEGAVYICVEYMDGGSVEKVYGDGIPENILRKIILSTIMGLKSLKDEHNIIHRDVKPTNILINTRGQIKICDFGVSGNLVASIAKTNIGCQSYMAPERISGGGATPGGGTYSVQSDIWSLGLTVVECAMGRYPYPPETFNNIFSQLNAIVHGDPPELPEEGYSAEAKDFVQGCLNKIAALRPSYDLLLLHPWLSSLIQLPYYHHPSRRHRTTDGDNSADGVGMDMDIDMDMDIGIGANVDPSKCTSTPLETADGEVAAWVIDALDRRARGVMGKLERPALHAVALDAVPGSPLLEHSSAPSRN